MNGRDDNDQRKTTQDYWEASWAGLEVPDPVDPAADTVENRLHRALHASFMESLGPRAKAGARLIEIGCGGSRWLPYFGRTYGYDLAGIDYSPAGIELLRRILTKAGISATLVQGDMFEPPADLVEAFDVVVSFGVVEHFEETAHAVRACARYLKPGGIMLTEVPTMRGPYGLVYRLFRPAIYRIHVPQTRESLASAHRSAGLEVVSSRYVLGTPNVLTRPTTQTSVLRRLAFHIGALYQRMDDAGYGIPPNRFTSPYALCIATKPQHAAVRP